MTDKNFVKIKKDKKKMVKKFLIDLQNKYGSMTQDQFKEWLNN